MCKQHPWVAAWMILALSLSLAAGCNGQLQDSDTPTGPDIESDAADNGSADLDAAANGAADLHPDAEAAPAFTLHDTHGNEVSLDDFRGQWVLLEWINHDCPFVIKFYEPGRMQEFQRTYTERDVVWLSIASSAPGKQGHESPERWNELTEEKDAAPTAVLIDEDGEVGRAYNARTTPQIVVIDPQGRLIYNGGIDNIRSRRSDDIDRADNYVVQVLDAVLAGEPAPLRSSEPYGCAVHY